MLFVCHPQILHKNCLEFLLRVKMAPRETENNAYAKFWGDKQRALWYVMVFSVVVNYGRWHSIPTVYSRRAFWTWACEAYLTGWQSSCLRPASSNRRILDREFSYASLKSRSADLSRTALMRSSTSFSNEASTNTSPSVPDWMMVSRPWQCSSKSLKKACVRK